MLTAIIYGNSELWALYIIDKAQGFRDNVDTPLDAFSLLSLFIFNFNTQNNWSNNIK